MQNANKITSRFVRMYFLGHVYKKEEIYYFTHNYIIAEPPDGWLSHLASDICFKQDVIVLFRPRL